MINVRRWAGNCEGSRSVCRDYWEGQKVMNGIAKVGNTHPRYKEGISYFILKGEGFKWN